MQASNTVHTQAMPQTYLTRRDASQSFYFRRRVPDHLRLHRQQRNFYFPPHPRPRTAERLARQDAVDTDAQFLLHEQLCAQPAEPAP